MDNRTAGDQTTSLAEERGAGGKLRKAPTRRAASTPYARPQQTQAQRGRWFSKLVDPACRLIAGGATYIFPSFFSKSEAVAASADEDDDYEELETEVERNSGDNDDANGGLSLNHVGSRSTDVASTSKAAEQSKDRFDVDGNERQKQGDMSGHNGVSEIEQLIRDKNFSRDDINRLLDMIRSRAADVPNVQQERKSSTVVAQDVGQPQVSFEYGKTFKEIPEDSNRAIYGTSKLQENKYPSPLFRNIGESAVSLETSRKPSEDELGYFSRATWETSTPFLQTSQRNNVGTSPIEIAKAYMENRTLELGFGSKGLISKDKEVLQHDDGVASKPLIPLPSPKPSTCWPGAMVQDQCSYKTPLSQRGRFGLHNFPRTPYSRTIGSKSRSKLQGDSDMHLSSMPSHLRQSQASPYGQVGSRANVLDYGRRSVGPIRRIECKVSETPRGFSYFQSPVNNPPQEEDSSAFEKGKTSSSSKLRSAESKAQNSDMSVPTVPAHSSQVARKILEHLERNPPTPKDKSAEIKLATSWRKPQLSYATTNKTDGHYDSPHLGGLDSFHESETAVQQKNLNDNGRYSVFKASQEDANKANASVSNNSLTSGVKFGFTSSTRSNQSVPSLDSGKSQGSQQLLSAHEDVSNAVKEASGSEILSFQKKPPSSGTKPVLPAISISKASQRLAFSTDNNSGFTFPISASSSVSSEPPTPSIMPSSAAGGPQDGHSAPLYSFGSKRSSPAIAFSFPSTSNVPTANDSSDPKFNFGSEKPTRISFASIGKDSICY